MRTYRVSEVASIIGLHPNTVRLYEDWGLITKPERQPNGYRIYTDLHIAEFRLARVALDVEVLQNGLRQKIIGVIKTTATRDFDAAIAQTLAYLKLVNKERERAETAAVLATQLLRGEPVQNTHSFRRREVSQYLGISTDTLRNWEMNGLLTVKRKENGYRVYRDDDVRRLKIIYALRSANYSLSSILQLFTRLSTDPNEDVRRALDTPAENADMLAACDRLLNSLARAESNAFQILEMLKELNQKYA